MKTSAKGISFLKGLEGSKTSVYMDSGNAPTIGVGHLLTKEELRSGNIYINNEAVKYRNGLTSLQAGDLLAQDLMPVETVIDVYVDVPLKQCQFDALVSFTFNVGNASFKNSTLLKSLNAKLYGRVPGQLKRWVHDNGKAVPGLVNRRNKEIALWNGAY